VFIQPQEVTSKPMEKAFEPKVCIALSSAKYSFANLLSVMF